MHSMTGYGTGRVPLEEGSLLVEARSVNHRFLDVRIRLPTELAEHLQLVEGIVRGQLVRGRIEVTARLEAGATRIVGLDERRARAAIEALRTLRDDLAPGEPVPLSLLVAVPDLFGGASGLDPQEARRALEDASLEACKALWVMRAHEGAALGAELTRLLSEARAELAVIADRVPGMVQAYRHKLRDRITTLLGTPQVPLDLGRLEHEVALFADRADVAEEIARLHSHFDQLQRALASDEGSVGRKLDFLLQEMAREANTIGSKVADADITLHVVELKAVLERMREQVQNVL
jgi:uncharacterized protein (TIGR00255 family)